MTLDTLIIFVGAVIAVLPFLGFPIGFEHLFFFIAGVAVVGTGIAVRRQKAEHAIPPPPAHTPSFVESTPDAPSSVAPSENAEHQHDVI
jgi:hypothetical protein